MTNRLFLSLLLPLCLGVASADEPPPATKTGGRVLVIGDSHTMGPFGQELDRLIQQKNPSAQLELYGMSGTSTWSYFDHKTVRDRNGEERKVPIKLGPTAGGYRYHDDSG